MSSDGGARMRDVTGSSPRDAGRGNRIDLPDLSREVARREQSSRGRRVARDSEESAVEREHAAVNVEAERSPLAQYWDAIRRYKVGIFVAPLLTLLMGLLYAFSVEPTYRATLTMEVEPQRPKIVSLQDFSAQPREDLFFDTQLSILRSRSVAERVIDELGLDVHPEFSNRAPGLAATVLGTVTQWLQTVLPEGAHIGTQSRVGDPAEQTRTKLVERFERRLAVARPLDSQIIRVSFEAKDPDLAADAANAVADAFVEQGLESRLAATRQATEWLSEQMNELRERLRESEERLVEYRESRQVLSTETVQAEQSRKLADVTGQLIDAQARRAEAEARYQQVRAEQGREDYESIAEVLDNPLIQSLKEEEARLERRVSELSQRYGERHPTMIAARTDLEEAKRRLEVEVNKVVEGIRKEYEVAVARERELKRLVDELKGQIQLESGEEFTLARLERDVDSNRALYETFLTRFKEASVASEDTGSNVRIIDPAKSPIEPYRPKKMQVAALSLLIGLLGALLLALLREHLDNTFSLAEDLERKVALPVLAMIPRLSRRRRQGGLLEHFVAEAPQSAFAEAIKTVRTSLMFSGTEDAPTRVVVTSSVQEEGKTVIAGNLAIAFSQLGPTLLIDADMRRLTLSKRLGSERSTVGLSDLLMGRAELSDVIKPSPYASDLFVLHAGTPAPNPLEMVSSRRMAVLLEAFSTQFSHVVIDSPPVLAVSEGLVLARDADAVMMVVKADATTDSTLRAGLKRLQGAGATPTGLVLNQIDTRKLRGYGGYYYGEEAYA